MRLMFFVLFFVFEFTYADMLEHITFNKNLILGQSSILNVYPEKKRIVVNRDTKGSYVVSSVCLRNSSNKEKISLFSHSMWNGRINKIKIQTIENDADTGDCLKVSTLLPLSNLAGIAIGKNQDHIEKLLKSNGFNRKNKGIYILTKKQKSFSCGEADMQIIYQFTFKNRKVKDLSVSYTETC